MHVERQTALEQGHLIDISEIAAAIGLHGAVAVSGGVGDALLAALPEGLSEEVQELLFQAELLRLLLRGQSGLGAADPEARQVAFEDKVLRVEDDGAGRPALSLYLAEELAA